MGKCITEVLKFGTGAQRDTECNNSGGWGKSALNIGTAVVVVVGGPNLATQKKRLPPAAFQRK